MSTGYRSYHRATTTGGVQVCGPGTLGLVSINTGAASAVVTIYDDTSAVAANEIAAIDASAACTRVFACDLVRGLWLVLASGSADITVTHT